MALREPVYAVEIHGAGPGYHAAYADLERSTHLDLGRSYLVQGDEARASIAAHDGQGDVRVVAVLAGPGSLADREGIEADTDDIVRFVERVTGVGLQWDGATGAWSLPGFGGGSVGDLAHRDAALEALRAVLATQRR
jgi:hypothetical protein